LAIELLVKCSGLKNKTNKHKHDTIHFFIEGTTMRDSKNTQYEAIPLTLSILPFSSLSQTPPSRRGKRGFHTPYSALSSSFSLEARLGAWGIEP
jgi:hypothetical protein